MKRAKIYLAGDHAGFKLKKKIKSYLEKKKFDVEDLGPHKYNSTDDYPDFVIPLAKKIASNKNSRGIIIAGSGQGEAMATNKFKGVRAALYHANNLRFLKMSRQHDDANVLCLGARFLDEKEMKEAITVWLKTKFSGGRHARRLKKFSKYGSKA
jgi:ribose 5-phosphate isomerase B